MTPSAAEPSSPAPLTVVAFAARVGVDESMVRKGIKNGRLERSLGRDAKGHVTIADVALAEQEWARNRDASKAGGQGLVSAADGKKRLTLAQARKVEIANRKQTGQLVSGRAAEIRYSTMVVTAKTKMRGIPSRAKQRIPHLTAADLAILAELIDEALEELADGR